MTGPKPQTAALYAEDLVRLLAQRHAGDVFVPQCKDGPTVNAHVLALDAWAMNRSWAHPRTFGYEIKVARADFTHDAKWHGYLDLCSEFYFVAPCGLIDKSELPAEAGLLVPASTGGRLLTKKLAPRRDVVPPAELYQYVLMCRAEIIPPLGARGHDSAAYWAH